jgi:hypothetical protein
LGPRIPQPIRNRVAQQWIAGLSRHKIAEENQIGDGTVSSIIREFKDDGFDLGLLREVAFVLKRENLQVDLLPNSVRLRMRLEKRGLIEMQIDSLIDAIDEHCFRHGITVEQFVSIIQEISSLSDKVEIPLDQLFEYVAREKKELESHKKGLKDTKTKIRKFLQASRVTLDDLEEYNRNKAKLQNYELMEKQINDQQDLLNYYSGPGKIIIDIDEERLKNISTFMEKPVTKHNLVKMLQYLCTNPLSNIDIFNSLQARSIVLSDNELGSNEPSTKGEN